MGGFILGWTQIWHFKTLINHRPWRAPARRRLSCCWFHIIVPCHSPMDTKPGPREILWAYTTCSWFSKAFGDAGVISDAILHGDFNRILYRYEKKPSSIVELFNSCWKKVNKCTFSYKVAWKKIHGWAKGEGASHRAPLKYAIWCQQCFQYTYRPRLKTSAVASRIASRPKV